MLVSLIILTVMASVTHGANLLPKSAIVAAHVILSAGTTFLFVGGFVAPAIGAVAVALYWAVLRRGKQARAELDYMTGKLLAGLDDIVRGYLPVLSGVPLLIYAGQYWMAGALLGLMFLPALVSAECNVKTELGEAWTARDKLYADAHGKARFWEMRRATEIASGFVGGAWAYSLVRGGMAFYG